MSVMLLNGNRKKKVWSIFRLSALGLWTAFTQTNNTPHPYGTRSE